MGGVGDRREMQANDDAVDFLEPMRGSTNIERSSERLTVINVTQANQTVAKAEKMNDSNCNVSNSPPGDTGQSMSQAILLMAQVAAAFSESDDENTDETEAEATFKQRLQQALQSQLLQNRLLEQTQRHDGMASSNLATTTQSDTEHIDLLPMQKHVEQRLGHQASNMSSLYPSRSDPVLLGDARIRHQPSLQSETGFPKSNGFSLQNSSISGSSTFNPLGKRKLAHTSLESDHESYVPLRQGQSSTSSSGASWENTLSPRRCHNSRRENDGGILAVSVTLLEAIWPLSRETTRSSTEGDGGGRLILRDFIREICRRSRASYSTLKLALYYLILLKGVLSTLEVTCEQPRESDIANPAFRGQLLLGQTARPKGCVEMQCGRRMFVSALMLATKYLQDSSLDVEAWGKISQLSFAELNHNEKAYLRSIAYRLYLKKEYFDNWSQIVLELGRVEKMKSESDYLNLNRDLRVEIVHDYEKTSHFLRAVREGTYGPICKRRKQYEW